MSIEIDTTLQIGTALRVFLWWKSHYSCVRSPPLSHCNITNFRNCHLLYWSFELRCWRSLKMQSCYLVKCWDINILLVGVESMGMPPLLFLDGDLCLLPSFLICLARNLSILLIFSRIQIWFHSLLIFLFPI